MATKTATQLDLADIQGNVLRGYSFPASAYVFVHVNDAGAGRRWLGSLVDPVTTSTEWEHDKPETTVNVALTYSGLQAVGVPERVLEEFPDEFRAGMAGHAELLGDTGPSAPEHWDQGLGTGEAHVLVILYARTEESLPAHVRWLEGTVAEHGAGLVNRQLAALLPFGREHFGFSDGFAQPAIEGSGAPALPGQGVPLKRNRWRPLKAGEFVLGYPDEDGGLPAAPPDPLGRNGTYVVYRKMYQDVALFRSFLREAGKDFPGGEERLAAKIVGRWPDGTPLSLSPDRPDQAIANDQQKVNDFRFASDPDGLICPLGAHVRRTYPRDALGWGGMMSLRHRVIRRGMPYGPPLPPDAPDDGVDRGLVFVCFQASLARQFEVMQGQWINDGNAFGLGHDRDFLLGDNFGSGKMTIHGRPPFLLTPQPSVVTIKGGEYLFKPGLDALRALADGLPA